MQTGKIITKTVFFVVMLTLTGCASLSLAKKQFIWNEPIKALKITVDYDPALYPSNTVCGKVTVQNYGKNDYKTVTLMMSFSDSTWNLNNKRFLATDTFCLTNGLSAGATQIIYPDICNPLDRVGGLLGNNTFTSCPISMNQGHVEINTEADSHIIRGSPVPDSTTPTPALKYRIKLLGSSSERLDMFSDNRITITFSPLRWYSDKFDFTLKNNSKEVITINWDKVSYVDLKGEAHRVVHAGVKYVDRNNSQAETTIPPFAKINDILVPSDNIYYEDAPSWISSSLARSLYGWKTRPLFARNGVNTASNSGKVSIFMPIRMGSTEYQYTFTFEVLAELDR